MKLSKDLEPVSKYLRSRYEPISARPRSKDEGALSALRVRSDTGIAEIGHIPFGLRRFSCLAALRLPRRSYCYGFLAAPCGYKKISRNASWRYFRDGFFRTAAPRSRRFSFHFLSISCHLLLPAKHFRYNIILCYNGNNLRHERILRNILRFR